MVRSFCETVSSPTSQLEVFRNVFSQHSTAKYTLVLCDMVHIELSDQNHKYKARQTILNASKNATFTVKPYSRFNAILSF